MGETIDKILYTSVVFYIILMIIIIVLKPQWMYDDKQQKFRSFGTDENETLITMPIVGLTSCIIIYLIIMIYTFLMIKLK